MFQEKKTAAIILMGGAGLRFGTICPKQFLMLGEKPVYQYALNTFLESGLFDEIILVCPRASQKQILSDIDASYSAEQAKTIRITPGGESRQESSFLGLQALSDKPDLVLIHDAVRPFVTQKILRENLEAAIAYGAADTCIPSADTLVYAPEKTVIASIPNRADFQRGQTPQTFRFDWIWEAHLQAKGKKTLNATDDCTLVASLGYPIAIVQGSEKNFKITSEFDLTLAEAFLGQAENRVCESLTC